MMRRKIFFLASQQPHRRTGGAECSTFGRQHPLIAWYVGEKLLQALSESRFRIESGVVRAGINEANPLLHRRAQHVQCIALIEQAITPKTRRTKANLRDLNACRAEQSLAHQSTLRTYSDLSCIEPKPSILQSIS